MPQGPEELYARSGIGTGRPPPFTAAQKRQFEIETSPERSQLLFRRGLLGLAFFVAYLGVDWLLTPDVFALSLVLRVGVTLPIGIAVLLIVRTNPHTIIREALPAVAAVLAGAVGIIIVATSHSVLRGHHHHTYILMALFVVIVLRLRFFYAAAACTAFFMLETTTILLYPAPEAALSATDLITFAAATVFCLLAADSFERNMRAAYLFGQHQFQRSANLENLSRHDPLTGLGNRRALDDAIDAIGQIGADIELAVIVADIDHFKSYNDALGHPAGDICLKRIAGLISAELRGDADQAIRFGGEEFLVLLPDTDLATALAIAERMRANIFDARIPQPGRSTGVVTASFGVASAHRSVSADELIAAADAALYAAKNAGRNQVWPRPLSGGAGVDRRRIQAG